jgi:hypothetical protein
VVVDPHHLLHLWYESDRTLRALEVMHREYQEENGSSLPGDTTPPRNLLLALETLWTALYEILNDSEELFRRAMVGTRALRKYCYKMNMDDRMSDTIDMAFTKEGKAVALGSASLRRFFLIFGIGSNPKPTRVKSLAFKVDQIYSEVRRDSLVKDLISPHAAYYLSQMAVASVCITQLSLYQPWAQVVQDNFTSTFQSKNATKSSRITTTPLHWLSLIQSYSFHDLALTRMCDPSDGRFEYPTNRGSGAKTINQMRAAEANLDNAWKMLDQFCRKRTARSWSELFDRDITQGRSIYRTPVWTPAAKPPKHTRVLQVPKDERKFIPLSPSNHDAKQDVTGNFDKSTVVEKIKEKTRGPEAPLPLIGNAEAIQDLGAERDAPPPPKLGLNKRSRAVFQSMCFSPQSANMPKEVAWTDFVHAMNAVGFESTQLGGSVWRFAQTDSRESMPINIHDPHDNHMKLSKARLRWIGKRLRRMYGWTGETFGLE